MTDLFARILHPAGTAQPPRHNLCTTTGCHDRAPDGTCHDCHEPLPADATTCEPTADWLARTGAPRGW